MKPRQADDHGADETHRQTIAGYVIAPNRMSRAKRGHNQVRHNRITPLWVAR